VSSDSEKIVGNVLKKCLDTDKKHLPSGVEPKHIYQVKLNSYLNTDKDSVSLNIYFKGVDSIKNSKYYTIDNLTISNFIRIYEAIYEVNKSMNDVFSLQIDDLEDG